MIYLYIYIYIYKYCTPLSPSAGTAQGLAGTEPACLQRELVAGRHVGVAGDADVHRRRIVCKGRSPPLSVPCAGANVPPVDSSVQLRRRQWRASVQRTRGPCCESPAAFSGLRERRHGVVWLVFHSRPWQARGLPGGRSSTLHDRRVRRGTGVFCTARAHRRGRHRGSCRHRSCTGSLATC
jgi:hypothetical protein